MAVFNWMSQKEIRESFKYKGFLLGIVPVYVDMDIDDPEEAWIHERNGIPFLYLWTVALGINAVIWLLNFGGLRPAFPNIYPLIITSEIE